MLQDLLKFWEVRCCILTCSFRDILMHFTDQISFSLSYFSLRHLSLLWSFSSLSPPLLLNIALKLFSLFYLIALSLSLLFYPPSHPTFLQPILSHYLGPCTPIAAYVVMETTPSCFSRSKRFGLGWGCKIPSMPRKNLKITMIVLKEFKTSVD